MNTAVRSRNNFGISGRAKVFFVVALLIVAWLVLGELAEGRSRIGQNENRLTPIQREIERQRQRLSSAEAEERRDALMRLGNLKRPEASRAAAGALVDIVPMVRVTAAHAIVSLPAREAVTLLLPMLRDKAEFVRREVAYVLGETRDHSSVPALIDLLLKDKQASVRGAAAVAVGQIGDETAVPALSQVLTGTDPTKKKKPKSREDDFVLRSAVRSLGQIRSQAGVPALIAALENSANSSDTRREAATALGMLGNSSALPALQAAYSSADDPYLAEAARVAIRKINLTKN